ncbi:MAG: ATP synthase subunit I [Burkholderiaceae bacterium]
MTVPIDHGAVRARYEDESDFQQLSRHPDPMTRAEAHALRARLGSVSPWRVVFAQGLVGLVCAGAFWVFSQHGTAAGSALYGAVAAVLPSALLARGMTRSASTRPASAVSAAAGFMFWEMLKIGVSVTMLVIAPRVVPDLSWPALLVTMVVCMKVNWLALLWRR